MTARAADEPGVRQFAATVERVDGAAVVLDETYFYPEGGGQPADRGALSAADDGLAVEVVDVQSEDGAVVHYLADPAPFEAGDEVAATVDDEFRTYCMRAHTASHVLYGAGRRLLEDLGYGGFDIGTEKVRVDLATPTEIDDATLVELERLANRAVWDSLPVSWETVPADEALDREDVAFNTKTEEGVAGDDVRLVTIEDWDVAACGGTHVSNTREIGPISVLERSNPGEGLTRVEFAVGPRAIRQRATERERAMAAASALDTRIEDLPDAVARLRDERDDLAADLEALRGDLVEARLADLREDAVERDGTAWVVGTVPGLDANALAERAQEAVGDGADAAALVGEDGGYLAVATGGDPDAGDVVDAVTDEFGGGGGGSPTVAQGGGLDADADAVVEFLRERAAD